MDVMTVFETHWEVEMELSRGLLSSVLRNAIHQAYVLMSPPSSQLEVHRSKVLHLIAVVLVS